MVRLIPKSSPVQQREYVSFPDGLFIAVIVTLFGVLYGSSRAGCSDSVKPGQNDNERENGAEGYISALRSKDREARVRAIRSLSKLRDKALPAVPALIDAFDDEDDTVSEMAALAAARVGPSAIPALVEGLNSPRTRITTRSASALGQIGPSATKAIKPLLTIAADSHNCSELRMEAINALGLIEDESAIPGLTDLLNGNDLEEIRRSAAEAIAVYGKRAKVALPSLVRIVKTYNRDSEKDALVDSVEFAIAKMGSDAVPALVEIAEDEVNETLIRRRAVQVLESVVVYKKGEAAAAVSALARLSVNEKLDTKLRTDSIRVLGMMWSHAAKACPDLETLLRDEHPSIRYAAADAITWIDPKNQNVVPTLVKGLEEKDELTRLKAVEGMGRCKSDPKRLVPALRKALTEDSDLVRLQAASSLGQLGKGAKEALPDLRRAAEDPEPSIRHNAKQAIEKIEGK